MTSLFTWIRWLKTPGTQKASLSIGFSPDNNSLGWISLCLYYYTIVIVSVILLKDADPEKLYSTMFVLSWSYWWDHIVCIKLMYKRNHIKVYKH